MKNTENACESKETSKQKQLCTHIDDISKYKGNHYQITTMVTHIKKKKKAKHNVKMVTKSQEKTTKECPSWLSG